MFRRAIQFSIISLLFFLPSKGTSQVLDTINYSLHQKPKIFLNIITFNSFIGDDFANFSGLRVGINYNRRVRFGVGLLGLNGGSIVHDITITEDSNTYTTNGDLAFGILAFSAEYLFYNVYPWQFGFIPFQIGFGSARYEYIRQSDDKRVSTESSSVVLYQPDLNGQYSIFRWFGIGASVGYRAVLYAPNTISQNFNSPTFSLGLKIFVDELYKMAFPNGLSGKKKGESSTNTN